MAYILLQLLCECILLRRNTVKKLLLAVALLLTGVANATPIYVGSWYVGEGPEWTSNPPVLNAQETAALLFGGNPSDYVISTISDQVSDINYMAYVDGWGDDQYLYNPVAQDFKLDTGNPGYNDPYGGPSYSAYVLDHSCYNRYANPNEPCLTNQIGLNFAFRVGAVPESGALSMLSVALVLSVFGFGRRNQII